MEYGDSATFVMHSQDLAAALHGWFLFLHHADKSLWGIAASRSPPLCMCMYGRVSLYSYLFLWEKKKHLAKNLMHILASGDSKNRRPGVLGTSPPLLPNRLE